MNITLTSPVTIDNYKKRTKLRPNINFGCNKIIAPDVIEKSMLSPNEIVTNVFKLANKIKFLNKILGKNDRTVKPVLMRLGEAEVHINMEKSKYGMRQINLYSDTNSEVYRYCDELHGYVAIEHPQTIRQSFDILMREKDGRMYRGNLNIVGGAMDFERDTKTGARNVKAEYFHFIPNLNEVHNMEDMAVQYYNRDKASNIVTSTFFNLFSNLTQVKPQISLK